MIDSGCPGWNKKFHRTAIIFCLDWTLWPFHVDTNPYPPVKMGKDGKIHDKNGDVFEPFPGVTKMFAGLFDQGYKMALVSRYRE